MLELQTSHEKALQERLTAPLLFLSSEEAGWDGLLVRAYHEPMEFEGWISPVVPEIALIVLTSGQMLLEHRRANGTWRGFPLRRNDLMLSPGGSANREVRWRSLSAEPMQTLHIHLDERVAERKEQYLYER